jgi:GTPase SAR1 family protein
MLTTVQAHHYIPEAKIILVGTKSDLRGDPEFVSNLQEKGLPFVTKKEAEQMQRDIKAVCYVETSAKTGENVKELFDAVTESLMCDNDVKPFQKKPNLRCQMM